MTLGLYYLVILIYCIQIAIDTSCLACTLLDPFVWSLFHVKNNILNQDEPTVSETVINPRWASIKIIWEKIIFLYPSLFKEGTENLTQVRYLLYWNACSNLPKCFFLFYPTWDILLLIALLYIFDCLVYEYEAFTANTLVFQKARIISLFSLIMSILSVIICLWLD